MEWILEGVSCLSILWLMNKGVWKITERGSFPWHLSYSLYDGSGCEPWLRHVAFSSFLCFVKMNKDRNGAKQMREIFTSGRHDKITAVPMALRVFENECKRKKEWEATPQALHFLLSSRSPVNILPKDLRGCIWLKRKERFPRHGYFVGLKEGKKKKKKRIFYSGGGEALEQVT